jgi:NADH-quinone oxidoreductase subunit C
MPEKEQFLKDMAGRISRVVDKPGRLYFDVEAGDLRDVVRHLSGPMGCRLSTATAMEMYGGIEVLYHFSHDATGQYYCPRVVITDKANPRVNSITPVVKGAAWIEREMFELMGITFEGHPRLERLLTKDHPQPPDRPLRLRRTK